MSDDFDLNKQSSGHSCLVSDITSRTLYNKIKYNTGLACSHKNNLSRCQHSQVSL